MDTDVDIDVDIDIENFNTDASTVNSVPACLQLNSGQCQIVATKEQPVPNCLFGETPILDRWLR